MAWWRSFALGAAVGLSVLGLLWWDGADSSAEVTRFVTLVESATIRRPSAEVFAVVDASIGGQEKSAISAAQASRIAWDAEARDGLTLEVDLGVLEDAWQQDGSAVVFRVGISFDEQYEDLVTRIVDARANAADRAWIPIQVPLSPYAGRKVSLIFNTAPAPGAPPGHMHRAVWGEPRLVQR